MLIRFLLILFKIDLESYYNTKVALVFHAFSSLFSLTIYYYTSKAFSGNIQGSLEKYQMDYFSYIVYGELALMLLSSLVNYSIQRLKMLQVKGVIDQLPYTKTSILSFIIQSTLMSIPRELFIFFTYLLMAILFFNFKITLLSVFGLIYFQLLILPTFIGFVIIAMGLLRRFGRGTGVIGYIMTLSTFLAGAYFPVEVFPTIISNNSLLLSPFNSLLITIRAMVSSQDPSILWSIPTIIICIWSISTFGISLWWFRWVERDIKANSPLVFYGR